MAYHAAPNSGWGIQPVGFMAGRETMLDDAGRRMIAARVAVLLLVLVSMSARGEDLAEVPAGTQERPIGDRISLSQAVGRALGRGFLAQIARLESGQAEEQMLELRGAYLPQLLIEAQAGWSNRIN
ncbi:MAG: hypothetical protein VCB42_03525, partial [Myxococcota bacterium]